MPQENLDTSAVQRPSAFFGHITQTVRDLAAQYFAEAPKGITLDAGCGNGLFFASLPQPTGRLIGADMDFRLLVEAKQIFNDNKIEQADMVLGDVNALPFADGSFDNIFFLNTLINIQTDEIVHHLLHELMRICRPNGRIFLDIRNRANPLLHLRYWLHNRRENFVTRGYHLRQLSGTFATNGFHISRKSRIGSPLPLMALGYFLEVSASTSD